MTASNGKGNINASPMNRIKNAAAAIFSHRSSIGRLNCFKIKNIIFYYLSTLSSSINLTIKYKIFYQNNFIRTIFLFIL